MGAIYQVTLFLERCSKKKKKKKNYNNNNNHHSIHNDNNHNHNNNDNNDNDHTTSSVWVNVVTGTGSHSPFGPILKPAIQNLFIKREMEYYLDTTSGCFYVD